MSSGTSRRESRSVDRMTGEQWHAALAIAAKDFNGIAVHNDFQPDTVVQNVALLIKTLLFSWVCVEYLSNWGPSCGMKWPQCQTGRFTSQSRFLRRATIAALTKGKAKGCDCGFAWISSRLSWLIWRTAMVVYGMTFPLLQWHKAKLKWREKLAFFLSC